MNSYLIFSTIIKVIWYLSNPFKSYLNNYNSLVLMIMYIFYFKKSIITFLGQREESGK